MGPFELMNVTGIPIAVHASTTLGNELGPFYATADILKTQMGKSENWDLAGTVDESKIAAVMDRFFTRSGEIRRRKILVTKGG